LSPVIASFDRPYRRYGTGVGSVRRVYATPHTLSPARRLGVGGAVAPVLVSVLFFSCARQSASLLPTAASVLVSPQPARIGAPISLIYSLDLDSGESGETARDAKVHFYDQQGQLLWTDDHALQLSSDGGPAPTHISYTRWSLVPAHVQPGPIVARLQLASPRKTGKPVRASEVDVARFMAQRDVDEIPAVFTTGWYGVEPAATSPVTEWSWSGQEGMIAFANPRQNVHVSVFADQPAPIGREQEVSLLAAGNVVDRFSIRPGARELRQVTIPADRLGATPRVTLSWRVDQTFTPSAIPALASDDTRALGIRVSAIHVARTTGH
jgi:hypothetical protein